MTWNDLYNGLPKDNEPLLTMVVDDEGTKVYAHAIMRDGVVYYQTNNGEIDTIPAYECVGREHIYYIHVNEIEMPVYSFNPN